MFEVGFTELLLCFIVALVVLGPERLPKLASTLGRWAGQARGYVRRLRTELERETEVVELKRQLEDTRRELERQAQDTADAARGTPPRKP